MTRPSRWLAGMAPLALAAACASSTETPNESAARRAPVTVDEDGDERGGEVARTARFVFMSRFEWNLFDRLFRAATKGVDTMRACVDARPREERQAYDEAVRAFAALADDERGRRALRVRIGLFDPSMDVDEALGAMPTWVAPALLGAAPAYRVCAWRADRERNLAWIAALTPLLARGEERMAALIARAHGTTWPAGPVVVDVVPWANDEGANTLFSPAHALISSVAPENAGDAALEIVFHEASHTFVTPRGPASIEALARAAKRLDRDVPRDLWHVILFAAAGEAARLVVDEAFGRAYTPYMIAHGLYTNAWPQFEEPVARCYVPFIAGEGALDLDAVAACLVEASAPPRAASSTEAP